MFETLRDRLQEVFRRVSGRGVLRAEDVDAALREVRRALLEADVHFQVARDFVARAREKAVGREVWKHLNPAQQVIQIVYEELVGLLGTEHRELRPAPKPPTVVLLCGLQGSGKTTQAAKLGNYLRRKGRRPLLVAADLQRPAAVQQLLVVGRAAGVPVFTLESRDPVKVVHRSLEHARKEGHDWVLVDTAGRLHVDEEMMADLRRVREAASPHHVLLVVDAMTGQEALAVAQQFNAQIGIDGIILTKLDGDARGGAALSVVSVTGKPIVFVGTGEKVEALEPFYPDRMASRILGMGDVLTLIERAQEAVSAERAEELQRKLRRAEFTLEDFRQQLREVRKMGPLHSLLEMIPGLAQVRGLREELDEREMVRFEAILDSMTPEERRDPSILNSSRKRRIARGSGTTVQDVNRLLRQFEETRRMIRQLESAGRRMGKWKWPF
ncbi:MAG: signal recognition particle protein [Armatimonadota bacterium]|nr:signal recognition particle protein [Armatimonadota bacterium]MDR7439887.1 signal recognition particle protein [Armatimonadota bacterium]MDR7563318.1 signal recognition particle protein [Armatimonadota bacterium]MDR7567472.1 signal recognition particle protein [Armatimonadota bacterium]MDR7601979.1 signal recognition particle protein [Armatimonadota bacterium]